MQLREDEGIIGEDVEIMQFKFFVFQGIGVEILRVFSLFKVIWLINVEWRIKFRFFDIQIKRL